MNFSFSVLFHIKAIAVSNILLMIAASKYLIHWYRCYLYWGRNSRSTFTSDAHFLNACATLLLVTYLVLPDNCYPGWWWLPLQP